MPDPDEIAEGAMHRALQGWPTDRTQHTADLAAMPAEDPGGLGPVTLSEASGLFAVLRDIADTEPVAYEYGRRCAMCGVHTHTESETDPLPHLISCPWARAVQIVGVKADG